MTKDAIKIKSFVERLQKIGVNVKLMGNYPWIYITDINKISVTEKFQSDHHFTLAFQPIRVGQELNFTDLNEIFNLLRKYISPRYRFYRKYLKPVQQKVRRIFRSIP